MTYSPFPSFSAVMTEALRIRFVVRSNGKISDWSLCSYTSRAVSLGGSSKSWCLLDTPWRIVRACSDGEDPRHTGETLVWPGILSEEQEEVAQVGKLWVSLSRLLEGQKNKDEWNRRKIKSVNIYITKVSFLLCFVFVIKSLWLAGQQQPHCIVFSSFMCNSYIKRNPSNFEKTREPDMTKPFHFITCVSPSISSFSRDANEATSG